LHAADDGLLFWEMYANRLGFAVVSLMLAPACSEQYTSISDAGRSDGAGGGPDAGELIGTRCEKDVDCASAALTFIPSGCGAAICQSGSCKYVALDADGDGFPAAACSTNIATRKVEVGTDCDDSNSKLYPGASVECVGAGANDFIGEPKGICKRGKLACDAGNPSAKPTCVGYVGPAKENCSTANVDEDCDGNPVNGCACTAADNGMPCGSSIGECVAGTKLCVDNSLTCQGAKPAAARDCASPKDNDCNGTPDNQEADCKCDGSAIGTTGQCPTVGNNATGNCRPGTRQCLSNKGSAAWSPCAGRVSAKTEDCSQLADDADCDGATAESQFAPANGAVCGNMYLCFSAGRRPILRCVAGNTISVNPCAGLYFLYGFGIDPVKGACPAQTTPAAPGGLTFSYLGSVEAANRCCADVTGSIACKGPPTICLPN
jgi:hypothetical protein